LRSRRAAAVFLATALFAAGAAGAAGAAEDGVAVQGGWMRIIIPQRPAAGYFTLQNTTTAGKFLVGARSPACGDLMMHQSVSQGGQERMVMVMRAKLPAHGTLTFAPGGYHLMCMQPNAAALKPGGSVPVTLVFADGGTISAAFAVRGANAP
jgi:copper(I)-binding protein